MLALGYKASAEQFGPRQLLSYALEAEAHGFDSVAVSDHFQPFRHTGGHAPAALPWLGALAVQSERIRFGTSVSTPTLRVHPSIMAQSFATIASLAPGRVWLGVGTGESMNEVPALGIAWPRFAERLERLAEAVELMRLLWTEDRVTYDGAYYRTANATVYDKPDRPAADPDRGRRRQGRPFRRARRATATSPPAASRSSSTPRRCCPRWSRAPAMPAATRPPSACSR